MLAEAENLLEVSRSELNLMQQKLASIENELKAAGMRELRSLNLRRSN
jgi:hypothetical protein